MSIKALNSMGEIKKKYGENVVNMAILTLLQKGTDFLKTADIEDICRELIITTPGNAIISGVVLADVMRCAAECAKLPQKELLHYIKASVNVKGVYAQEGKLIAFYNDETEEHITSFFVPMDTDDCTLDDLADEIAETVRNVDYDTDDCDIKTVIRRAFRDANIETTYIKADLTYDI